MTLKYNSILYIRISSLKISILFFLNVLLFFRTQAQVADLLKNKNITWVTESYNDFNADVTLRDSVEIGLSHNVRLKILNLKETHLYNSYSFQDILLESVKSGKTPIYKDSDCKIVTKYDSIRIIDTIVSVDTNTHKPKIMVVEQGINPWDIFVFRARQVIFYDAEKVQFGLRTLAVAPIFIKKKEGEKSIWQPLFWIKATDIPKSRNLRDKNITWAQRMYFSKGVLLVE